MKYLTQRHKEQRRRGHKRLLYGASLLYLASIMSFVQAADNHALSGNLSHTNTTAASNSFVSKSETQSATALPPRVDYPSFRMIVERNIFNPNRSRRGTQTYREERRSTPRTESFALLGTMSYEKGLFAFFDGTSSDYRKVLKTGDEIAGYKVAGIAYNKVKLATQTNEVELPVGMQMRREEEGEWSVSQQIASYNNTSSNSSGPSSSSSSSNGGYRRSYSRSSSSTTEQAQPVSTSAATNAATEASSGSADEILQRLMQRREETLNK